MNLKELFKRVTVFAIIIAGYSCSSNRPIRIIPLSPYSWNDTENGIATHSYFYAIDGFSNSKRQKTTVDTFVLNHVPKEYLKENNQVRFVFYKYEKGRIDENFVHKEQPKQQNIFMEANPKHLLVYLWDQGKFSTVAIYKNGQYEKMEKRDW